MPLPNTGMSFTPFDPLPASDLNDLVENIEALADGTGQDSTAVLVQSNPYKFSVYRNAAWTTPSSTETKVAFDAETFDTNSNFDSATNNRYVAPVAGFYLFTAQVQFASAVNNAYILLYKNGAEVKSGSQIVATNVLGSSISSLLQLSASDYIEVFLFTSSAQTGTTGANNTYFEGFLVSRT